MDQAHTLMTLAASSVIARHLDISGRVQGVWYRNWAADTARMLGLAGWVRNRTDGNVEAWVEGSEESIDRFITLAHDGPPAASVAQIAVQEGQPQGFTSFEKRPTG